MTLVPAYLNGLSEAALAAYARWSDALIARAEHVLDCSCCNDRHYCCPAGIAANTAEQVAYREFQARRREGRG